MLINTNDKVIQEILVERHRVLRDGRIHPELGVAHYTADLLERLGIISAVEAKGWHLMFDHECPGHDDEGGRDWCAYCGKMPAKTEEVDNETA